jgi:hypothetical protein
MIRVSGDLQPLINKVEKLPIEIQSAVAEAMMASEQGIYSILSSEYSGIFQDFEIEASSDLSINITLNKGDVYHFQNATGSGIDYLLEPIKNVVNQNLNESIAKCMGGGYGS